MKLVKKISLVVKKSYIVVIFLIIAILGYLTLSQSETSEISKFEKKYNQALNTLDTWQKETTNLKHAEFLRFFQEKDVSAWIYAQGNLVGWSNNKYPEPDKDVVKKIKNSELSYISNGWYLLKQWSKNDTTYVIQLPIYINYTFWNDLIQSHFSSFFRGIRHLKLIPPSDSKSTSCIYLNDTELCLPYTYQSKFNEDDSFQWLIPLLFYGLSFLLFFGARKIILLYLKNSWIKIIFILFSTFFIWLLLHVIYSFTVWSGLLIKQPNFFAWSIRIPSLADLLNILISVLWLVGLLFSWFKSYLETQRENILSILIAFVLSMAMWFILALVYAYLPDFFLNSNWYWNFKDLTTFNPIQIWFFLPVLLVSTILFLIIMGGWIFSQKAKLTNRSFWFLFVLSGLIVYVVINPLFYVSDFLMLGGAITVASAIYRYIKPEKLRNTLLLFFALLFFSVITVMSLRNVYHEKLKQNLKILSLYLSSGRDHLAEYLLEETIRELDQKQELIRKDKAYVYESLIRVFNKGYLSNFSSQIIVCSSQDKVLIRPFNDECNCWDYFNNRIDSSGILVKPGIYFFTESNRGYYLVNFPLYQGSDTLQVYVELLPLMLEKTQDYPNLLLDKNSDVMVIPSFISYGVYHNHELTYSKGQFPFLFKMDSSFPGLRPEEFMESETHYFLKIVTDYGAELLLVGDKMSFNNVWTAFSFVFLLYAFYVLSIVIFFRGFTFFSIRETGLSARFQRILLWFILLSFTVSVFFSVQNILRISSRKNMELLHEKGQNFKIEIESMLSSDSTLFFSERLTSFILAQGYKNYMDINVYSKNGMLISTTRPELYERNLLTPYMNPVAFSLLKENTTPFIIQREKIEKLGYYSAYYPLYNRNYHLMGFLHVPYFTREQQFNEELFSYISSMVNLYLVIIFLGVILAYVLTAPVLKPLNLIKNSMKDIRLSGINEKIKWEGKDEIAELIQAYNHMVDELALKARQLAESERELAWRDMARQVAHEIKNPLTPMKLSTQYIWKLWLERDKDFAQKFESYIKTIQKQIDSLDSIASSFSSLGKLVNPDLSQKTSIHDLAAEIKTLFLSELYDLHVEVPNTDCWIVGDYQHWRQVLINLVKNAVQALVEYRRGVITMTVTSYEEYVMISIQDNGIGMTRDEMSRIFQPNFTTKTSGSGLGLAIVKTIVEMYGGSITFESEPGKGSCFTLVLKKYA